MTPPMARVTSRSDVMRRSHSEFNTRALQDIGITDRERDVLQLIAEGMGDKEIAASLALSTFTINKHVGAILRKIGAASRTEAAVRAVRSGLIV